MKTARIAFLLLFGPVSALGAEPDTITIVKPKKLPDAAIPCERITLGDADDYKPCIAMLPDGELILTAFHQHKKESGKVLEQALLFRSKDGGKTWSAPEKLDLLGREPYLTVLPDGTIFITGHLLSAADSDRAIFAGWPGPRRARLIAEWPGPKARGSHTSDRGVARANGAGPARLIAAKGRPVGVVGWMHVLM